MSSAVAGGRVTPTRTIFSRKDRSISDTATSSSSVTIGDVDGRRREVTSPVSGTVAEGDLDRAAGHVDGGAGRRPAPTRGRRRPTAQAPVPQARVGPTPRSYTTMSSSPGAAPGSDDLDVGAAGGRPVDGAPSATRSMSSAAPAGAPPASTRCGLPTSTRAAARARRPRPTRARRDDLGLRPCRRTMLGRRVEPREDGDGAERRRRWRPWHGGAAARPGSSSAWARQRMPLPLISAREPSALSSSMVTARGRPAPPVWRGGGRRRRGRCAGRTARAPGRRHGVGAVEVEQDEEVVAQAVVLGEAHAAFSLPDGGRCAGPFPHTAARSTAATSASSAPSRLAGSRWRRAR